MPYSIRRKVHIWKRVTSIYYSNFKGLKNWDKPHSFLIPLLSSMILVHIYVLMNFGSIPFIYYIKSKGKKE